MAEANRLKNSLIEELKSLKLWEEDFGKEIPSKWEKHGNCALLPAKSFCSSVWTIKSTLLETAAKILGVDKLARKSGPIHNDRFRRPAVELIFGPDPIVFRKENGIKYSWDITKCMFSSGNITEKQRLSRIDCRGEIVVDLYAGIGYFTLTYLVHSKADKVYACEWNPEAVKWLDNNLKLNKVSNHCVILPGDNLETCPKNVADRVNLGLIPSSEGSWKIACEALKRTSGGILHIHGNVDTDSQISSGFSDSINMNIECESEILSSKCIPRAWIIWSNYVAEKITEYITSLYPNEKWSISISNFVKIKSYGPRVDHVVIDIKCRPGLFSM